MQTSRYILTTVSKIFLVIILAIILFLVGLMVGYGVIGDGSPMDVFNSELWAHIFDFLDRDEATIQFMVAFLISILKEIGSEIISCIQKIRIVIRFSAFNESFNYLTLLFF